ncbi:conserved protein of unknown function [Pararobbsia alpina]|uniref:hypothetical protein n=1 Tax=Pararobbsia alpina TaxID=621374 RepID=UPI0039A4B620
MNATASQYRGSEKHKNRPSHGAKGTLCPEWTHSIPQSGYEGDPFHHDWSQTEAHTLFAAAVPHPDGEERCYATMNGIAFEAKPTNDGKWHGYPVPWKSVPDLIVDQWLESRAVTNRQIKQRQKYLKTNIHWALEVNPND